MGMVLSWSGYITPSGSEFPPQPGEAIQAIRVFTSLVPAVFLLLAIVCGWFYPISREVHRELRAELAEADSRS
jgi:GPH family glycoside/pentoside/hexuronide:cation symporter